MMESLRFWLLAIVVAALALFVLQSSKVAQPAVQYYAIQVDLDPQSRVLEVEARVQLKMSRPSRRGALYLFRAGGHYKLLEARFEGAQGQTAVEGDWYVFKFVASSDEPLAVLRYRIQSSPDIEGIAFHLGSDEGYVLSEATWIPKATKEIGINSPTSYRLTVRLPDPFIAVSAGTLAGESHTDGRASFTWEMSLGSPFFAYGLYDVMREPSGEIYVLRTLGEKGLQGGQELLEASREILAYYTELFGPPPELPLKIVSVTRRGGWGAPLTLLLNTSAFTEEVTEEFAKTYGFLAHELAHTWWGGLVTCAAFRGCGWLTEGMADYAKALALGHRYGTDSERAIFQDYRDSYIFKAADDVPLTQQAPRDPLYRYSSYLKGAWVHRMLEGLLGRERYLSALKEFVQTHRGQTISPKKYQQAMERAYGGSLEWFFQQWVHQVKLPVYRVEMQSGVVRIINEGSGEMPLAVRLHYEDGTSEDVHVLVREAASIAVHKPIARVTLDPHGYVLHGLQRGVQQEAIDEAVRAELIQLANLLEKAIQTGDFAPVEAALIDDAQTQKMLAILKSIGGKFPSFKTDLQEIRYDPQTQTYIVMLQGTIVHESQQLKGPVQWWFKKIEEGWSLVNVKIKI